LAYLSAAVNHAVNLKVWRFGLWGGFEFGGEFSVGKGELSGNFVGGVFPLITWLLTQLVKVEANSKFKNMLSLRLSRAGKKFS
jgi:hypothetical protein